MDPVTLAQAGPVAILLVGIGLLFRAFKNGDMVPGHIYLAERAARIKAEASRDELVADLRAVTRVAVNGNGKAGPPHG